VRAPEALRTVPLVPERESRSLLGPQILQLQAPPVAERADPAEPAPALALLRGDHQGGPVPAAGEPADGLVGSLTPGDHAQVVIREVVAERVGTRVAAREQLPNEEHPALLRAAQQRLALVVVLGDDEACEPVRVGEEEPRAALEQLPPMRGAERVVLDDLKPGLPLHGVAEPVLEGDRLERDAQPRALAGALGVELRAGLGQRLVGQGAQLAADRGFRAHLDGLRELRTLDRPLRQLLSKAGGVVVDQLHPAGAELGHEEAKGRIHLSVHRRNSHVKPRDS
jgi:hypothetical protein